VNQHLHWYLHFLELDLLELIINKGNVKFLEIRPLKELIINRGNVKFGLQLSLFSLKMGYISHVLEATQKKCEAFTMVPDFCFTQSCAHFFNTRQLGLLYRIAACTSRISAFFGGMGSTSPFHST
jgi:hypothetical protein